MRKFLSIGISLGMVLLMVFAAFAQEGKVTKAHAIAMHGEPKYGPGFTHFDYVNPNAPKGGSVVYGTTGDFDSFNPFILKGRTAVGIGALYESLTVGSSDEAFTEYGLIAETIEWPEDRSWVAYTLRPEARWQDGVPITVEDVIFTLEILKTKGHPFYQFYYANLVNAEKIGPRKVKISFSGEPNPELPLITGQMTILPKHYWENRDFEETTLEPPLGSGPYKIKSFDQPSSITYERDPNYWGRNLPLNIGQVNIDTIRYDYYTDRAVLREAFKGGEIDMFSENVAKDWAQSYNIPAVEQGLIKKREIPDENPQGMQAFIFNTRRDIFKDKKVREALGYAFDFEWSNTNLFYNAYTRTDSYFENSELASSGLPSGEELEILSKYRGRVPDEVFTETFAPPKTDGSGNIRGGIRNALALLKEAGWEVKDGKLTNLETGNAMSFELLLISPAFERVVLPFSKNLERLGVETTVNTIDSAQYQKRLETFDFDMIITTWRQSLSPGNEQRNFWSSSSADTDGSRNFAGIKDLVVDELIELIISAPDRDSLIARTRALDRVLLWNHYVIPNWHLNKYRIAHWDKYAAPKIKPKYSSGVGTWWIDPEKEATLDDRKR